jgi:hypothetical protein
LLRFRFKKSEQAGGVEVFLLLTHRATEYFQATYFVEQLILAVHPKFRSVKPEA